jgi:protein disulfide-isomerase A4
MYKICQNSDHNIDPPESANRPLIVAYYDVNYDHQFLKDTQYIRNKIVEVAKKFSTSNLKFAISNEVEFEDEIK